METNSSLEDFFTLSIDTTAKEFLKGASIWAKIVAVMGFISAGLTVFDAVVNKLGNSENIFAGVAPIIGALIIGGISVALNLFLFRFASKMSSSLVTMNQIEFNQGVNNLSGYFKFLGVLFIIFLSLFFLAMLFVMLGRGFSY